METGEARVIVTPQEAAAMLNVDLANGDTWPPVLLAQFNRKEPAQWEGHVFKSVESLRVAVLLEASERHNARECAWLEALLTTLEDLLPRGGLEWKLLDSLTSAIYGMQWSYAEDSLRMVDRLNARLATDLEALCDELITATPDPATPAEVYEE